MPAAVHRVDVAIGGGGPSGSAAAIVLARAGLSVLLADAGEQPAYRVGEGLPPNSMSLLNDLDVARHLEADGHRDSPGTLAWWGSDRPHANDFMFGVQGSGLQLDRAAFDRRLRNQAQAVGAKVVAGSALRATVAISPFRLSLGADFVDADFLIDATGRASSLSRALGARRLRFDRSIAFHGLMASDAPDQDGRTFVEAVAEGWWYSVLLPNQNRVLAFFGDADLVDPAAMLSPTGLWEAFSRASHLFALCDRHGYRLAGRIQGADTGSSILDNPVGDRWLAVGDAASAFDPLSSKGIANALYTGIKGAEAVLAAHAGDATALSRYAEHMREIHRVYRGHLAAFYGMERRWPDAPFWRRRQSNSHAAAEA